MPLEEQSLQCHMHTVNQEDEPARLVTILHVSKYKCCNRKEETARLDRNSSASYPFALTREEIKGTIIMMLAPAGLLVCAVPLYTTPPLRSWAFRGFTSLS